MFCATPLRSTVKETVYSTVGDATATKTVYSTVADVTVAKTLYSTVVTVQNSMALMDHGRKTSEGANLAFQCIFVLNSVKHKFFPVSIVNYRVNVFNSYDKKSSNRIKFFGFIYRIYIEFK